VIFLLLASALSAAAGDVRVLIAPRTAAIPGSGKVVFDIYWVNDGDKTAAIPLLERYRFFYSPVGPGSTAVGLQLHTVDHTGRDRHIAPRSVVRDTASAKIDAGGAQLVEVSAEFRGEKSRYKSNSVVLRVGR
jgi:hypothetical protein